MNLRVAVVIGALISACGPGPQSGIDGGGGGGGDATGGGAGATAPGKLQVSWTVNGSAANHSAACTAWDLTFFKVKATLQGPATQELDLAVDCVNGAWQSEEKVVPSGRYTVVLEGHSGQPFSGPLAASVSKEVVVSAGSSLTTATLDLALGNVEVSWTIDGQASGAAMRCVAEDVTFWVAKLGGADSVGVSCVNGRWSVPFKAVPAGTYVARVEAHNGTPTGGPLKVAKEAMVTVVAGGMPSVVINFLGSEL
jgi:hypothetical protein